MNIKRIAPLFAVVYFCIGFYFYFPAIGYLSSCPSILLDDMNVLFWGKLISGLAWLLFLFIPMVIFFKRGVGSRRLIIQQIIGFILLAIFMTIFKSVDRSTCLLGDAVYDTRILASMVISIVVSTALAFRMKK